MLGGTLGAPLFCKTANVARQGHNSIINFNADM
jgi:hypothetical protein